MVQKSGNHQLRLVVYPVISGGAGFLPSSTVLWCSWKPRLGLQYSIQSYDGAAGVPPECSDVTHLEGSQYWANSLGMIQQVIRFWNFLMARCILLGWLDKWQSLCFLNIWDHLRFNRVLVADDRQDTSDRFFFIDSVLGNGKLRRHRLLCRYVDRSD